MCSVTGLCQLQGWGVVGSCQYIKRYVAIHIVPSKPHEALLSLGHSSLLWLLQMVSGKMASGLCAFFALLAQVVSLVSWMVPAAWPCCTYTGIMTKAEVRVMLTAVIQTLLTTQALHTHIHTKTDTELTFLMQPINAMPNPSNQKESFCILNCKLLLFKENKIQLNFPFLVSCGYQPNFPTRVKHLKYFYRHVCYIVLYIFLYICVCKECEQTYMTICLYIILQWTLVIMLWKWIAPAHCFLKEKYIYIFYR